MPPRSDTRSVPRSSGPRCRIMSVIAASTLGSAGAPSMLTNPAIPHIDKGDLPWAAARLPNEHVDVLRPETTGLVMRAAHRDLREHVLVAHGIPVGIDVEHDAVHLE